MCLKSDTLLEITEYEDEIKHEETAMLICIGYEPKEKAQ
jgi:hypothetical protein